MKKLTIKMFAPGNRTHKTIILSAGKGKVFKPGGEFDVLSKRGRIAGNAVPQR